MNHCVPMCSINISNYLFIDSLCPTNFFSFTTNFMVVVLWCVSWHTVAGAFSSQNWHNFLPHAETRYLAIRLRVRLQEYPIIKRENRKIISCTTNARHQSVWVLPKCRSCWILFKHHHKCLTEFLYNWYIVE